jgi:Trypsin-like peptidase domain
MGRQAIVAVALSGLLVASVTTAQAPPTPLDANQVFEANKNAVLQIKVTGAPRTGQAVSRYGTGFLIHRDGYLITAGHVPGPDSEWQEDPNTGGLRRTIEVKALNAAGRTETLDGVTVAYHDAQLDLALLRAHCQNCPIVRLGDSRSIATGKTVHTVIWGSLDKPEAATGTAASPYDSRYSGLVKLNVNLGPGDSGAPIFDPHQGNVVGVLLAGRKDFRNQVFALPINLASNMLAMTWRTAAVEDAIDALEKFRTDAKMPLFPNVAAKFKQIDDIIERLKQNIRLEPMLRRRPNAAIGPEDYQFVLDIYIQSDFDGQYLPTKIDGKVYAAWNVSLKGADKGKTVPTAMTEADTRTAGFAVLVDADKEMIDSFSRRNAPLGFLIDAPLKAKLKEKLGLSDATLRTLHISAADIELEWEVPNAPAPRKAFTRAGLQ